jgi:hypothetical protein
MMDKTKNRTFKYKNKIYSVISPTNKIRRESDAVYAKSYRKAIQDGYFLEAEVEDVLKDRGYVEKEVNKKKNGLLREIRSLESKLVKREFKDKNEGREMALDVKELRDTLDALDAPKNELTSQCANTVAENRRFSYFAYACVLDSEGDRIWGCFEDFENDETELAYSAATEVLSLIYEGNQVIVKGIELQKYENKWLIDNGYMDDGFHFLDDSGNKTDKEGRLIDEEFNFIDTQGRRVDVFGNLIDGTGTIITEEDLKPKKKTVTKKATRKKAPTKKSAEATEDLTEES